MKRNLYNEDHEAFRGSVGAFLDREVVPYFEQWEDDHLVDREMWRKAAQSGIIGLAIPEEFGGGGVADFRFEMVRSKRSPGAASVRLRAAGAYRTESYPVTSWSWARRLRRRST